MTIYIWRLYSTMPQERHIERREHQDNADIGYEPDHEMVPKEEDIHADDDRHHDKYIKYGVSRASHQSKLLTVHAVGLFTGFANEYALTPRRVQYSSPVDHSNEIHLHRVRRLSSLAFPDLRWTCRRS